MLPNGSGFTVKVVTPENYITRDSGLILRDVAVGEGDCPKDGQQVSLLLSCFLNNCELLVLK